MHTITKHLRNVCFSRDALFEHRMYRYIGIFHVKHVRKYILALLSDILDGTWFFIDQHPLVERHVTKCQFVNGWNEDDWVAPPTTKYSQFTSIGVIRG